MMIIYRTLDNPEINFEMDIGGLSFGVDKITFSFNDTGDSIFGWYDNEKVVSSLEDNIHVEWAC